MLETFRRIRRVAQHFRTVLIKDETGTGKEPAARALHDHTQLLLPMTFVRAEENVTVCWEVIKPRGILLPIGSRAHDETQNVSWNRGGCVWRVREAASYDSFNLPMELF